MKQQLDQCISREDFENTCRELDLAKSQIKFFKTQMQLFERKFLADMDHEMCKDDAQNLLEKRDFVFMPPAESGNKKAVNRIDDSMN